ncbi:hypothetical protein HKB31_10760 [Vibrio alginolyticus]|uniref:hypothetical protein n=1 Tax=Vibrio TaxID=662 RepID=UPI00111DEFEE|nr:MULTISPECIES: hypothetical protein [Vibrio]MDW2302527.1 hypothetical protein [Vibrio sp. 1167]NMT94247.1 hypothetical protein [Vibrio alginolyticus]TOP86699.1 hypothetical protein CGH07_22805 [Vibrio parahaemolyticus]HCG6133652.1 hypothetical protein [Vibrio parahaemolyticus]
MTGIMPDNHYNYAAICVENLGQSGVLVTCQPLDLESFGAEGHVLILCSNKTAAIKCVRIELLQRSQCECALLHFDHATKRCDYELAKLLENYDAVADIKADIRTIERRIGDMKRVRAMDVQELALTDLLPMEEISFEMTKSLIKTPVY